MASDLKKLWYYIEPNSNALPIILSIDKSLLEFMYVFSSFTIVVVRIGIWTNKYYFIWSELCFCSFNLYNPFTVHISLFMMLPNSFLIWCIKYTETYIRVLIEKKVHMCYTKFIPRWCTELLKMFLSKRNFVSIHKYWHLIVYLLFKRPITHISFTLKIEFLVESKKSLS